MLLIFLSFTRNIHPVLSWILPARIYHMRAQVGYESTRCGQSHLNIILSGTHAISVPLIMTVDNWVGSAVVVVHSALVYVLRNVDFIFEGFYFHTCMISAFTRLKSHGRPFCSLSWDLYLSWIWTWAGVTSWNALRLFLEMKIMHLRTTWRLVLLCPMWTWSCVYCMCLIYAGSIDGSPVSKTPLCANKLQIIMDRCRSKETAASYIIQALIILMKFLYLSVATKTFELYNWFQKDLTVRIILSRSQISAVCWRLVGKCCSLRYRVYLRLWFLSLVIEYRREFYFDNSLAI
jgi:hypothetical protein